MTLTDTGERKELFGREARHIKTVMARQPGPNACEIEDDTRGNRRLVRRSSGSRLVPLGAGSRSPARLPPKALHRSREAAARGRSQDLGFAVATTTTTTTEDGKETGELELDDGSDRPAGDIARCANCSTLPSGYSEVKTYTELPPALAKGGSLTDALFGLRHRWHERCRAEEVPASSASASRRHREQDGPERPEPGDAHGALLAAFAIGALRGVAARRRDTGRSQSAMRRQGV